MHGVRLSAESSGGMAVRWAVRGGASCRLYRARSDLGSFCVSTRSAEVVVVLDGEIRFELGPKRQQLAARSGDVVVVARETPHRYWLRAGSATVVFDLDECVPLPPIAFASTGDALRLVELADRLARDDLAIHLPEVVGAAARASARLRHVLQVEPVQSTGLMHRVRGVLERSHTEAVSLEATARAHGIDPFYLSRAFKKNFGVTPQSYLQFLRTEHFVWESLCAAARGFESSELGRAAGDAGFGDYSTFSRRMRALFGKPPSALFQRG